MPRTSITEADMVHMMQTINDKDDRDLKLTKNILTGQWQIVDGNTVIIEGTKAMVGQCLTFYCRMNDFISFA